MTTDISPTAVPAARLSAPHVFSMATMMEQTGLENFSSAEIAESFPAYGPHPFDYDCYVEDERKGRFNYYPSDFTKAKKVKETKTQITVKTSSGEEIRFNKHRESWNAGNPMKEHGAKEYDMRLLRMNVASVERELAEAAARRDTSRRFNTAEKAITNTLKGLYNNYASRFDGTPEQLALIETFAADITATLKN